MRSRRRISATDSPNRSRPPVARYTLRRQPDPGAARFPCTRESVVRLPDVSCTGSGTGSGTGTGGSGGRRASRIPPRTPSAAGGPLPGAGGNVGRPRCWRELEARQRLHRRHGTRVRDEAQVRQVARVLRVVPALRPVPRVLRVSQLPRIIRVSRVAGVHRVARSLRITRLPRSRLMIPRGRPVPRDRQVARAGRILLLAGIERRLRIAGTGRLGFPGLAPAGPPVRRRVRLVLVRAARVVLLMGVSSGPARQDVTPVAGEVVRDAGAWAEDLRRIVVGGHRSSPLVLRGGRACGRGSSIYPSVSQSTRNFDTQSAGSVALSCDLWGSWLSG